jgi:hypothetical protein
MQILQGIILTILIAIVLILMKKYAIKNNKDLFEYGYWTGVIAVILAKIILG